MRRTISNAAQQAIEPERAQRKLVDCPLIGRARPVNLRVQRLTNGMISITPIEQDDPAFSHVVSRIVTSEARLLDPDEIYVVRIDRCFDRKWRQFAGVILPQLGVWWGPDLRVPPFHPHRVTEQLAFRRDPSVPSGYRNYDAKPLHKRQSSYRNVHRHLAQIAPSGLFVWYSGNTLQSDQATLLAYRIGRTQQMCWFASFRNGPDWKLDKTHGISIRELQMLLDVGAVDAAPN